MAEYKTYEEFAHACCCNCNANDWFCPSWCDILEKGSRMEFNRVQKALDRHDGDLIEVMKYIRRARNG